VITRPQSTTLVIILIHGMLDCDSDWLNTPQWHPMATKSSPTVADAHQRCFSSVSLEATSAQLLLPTKTIHCLNESQQSLFSAIFPRPKQGYILPLSVQCWDHAESCKWEIIFAQKAKCGLWHINSASSLVTVSINTMNCTPSTLF